MSTEPEVDPEIAEVLEATEDPVVEEPPEVDPETEAEARKYGWKPETEWKGEPPKYGFVSATDYLENPRVLSARLQDKLDAAEARAEADKRDFDQRIARQESAYREAEKRRAENHERELERLKSDQRKAAEEMDMERFDALAKQMDDLGDAPVVEEPKDTHSPPPEELAAVNAWRSDPKNSWFHANQYMQQAAMDAYSEAASAGIADGPGRLAYMENRIGQMFPGTISQPEPKRKAPAVDGGGLAGRTVSKVSKLPPEAKEAAKLFIEDGTFKDEAEYAEAYFKNSPDG